MKTNSNSGKLELRIASPRFVALCLLGIVLLLMALGMTGCKGGPCW